MLLGEEAHEAQDPQDVREALAHIEAQGSVSCAVLDVTLRDGETCMPVARELERREIPYILHSGDLNRQEGTLAALNARLIAKPACSSKVVDAALALVDYPPEKAEVLLRTSMVDLISSLN